MARIERARPVGRLSSDFVRGIADSGVRAFSCGVGFPRFSQAVDEIVEARIWAGLHFRTADVQAVELGTNVANFAAANYFEPVGNH